MEFRTVSKPQESYYGTIHRRLMRKDGDVNTYVEEYGSERKIHWQVYRDGFFVDGGQVGTMEQGLRKARKALPRILRRFALEEIQRQRFRKFNQKHYVRIIDKPEGATPRRPNFLIVDPQSFPLKPEHVDSSKHLWNSFGNTESEASAYWLCKLAQNRGGWYPFAFEEVQALYSQRHTGDFRLNRLACREYVPSITGESYEAGGGWIVRASDGLFYYTSDFVLRCCMSQFAVQKGDPLIRTFDDLWYHRLEPRSIGCDPTPVSI